MPAKKITAQTVTVAEDGMTATIEFEKLVLTYKILETFPEQEITVWQPIDGPCQAASLGAICINVGGLSPVWIDANGAGEWQMVTRATTGIAEAVGSYLDTGKMPVLYV